LYPPNIIGIIRSRAMRWPWHGRIEMHVVSWSGSVKKRYHLEDLDVDGRIILKWILKKYDVRIRTGFIWLRIATSRGFLWTQ
jgi:hypothetical protein